MLLKPEKRYLLLVIWLLCAHCVDDNDIGNMNPLLVPSKTVPSAVLSTSARKLVKDWHVGKRGALFVWSVMPPSPRILPLPKESISGRDAKQPSTRLSTFEFCKRIKLDNANAGRTPTCVLALRGGRGGVPGGRGAVVKVHRLIVKLGSQPYQHKHNVRTCTHNNSKKKYGTPIMLISL